MKSAQIVNPGKQNSFISNPAKRSVHIRFIHIFLLILLSGLPVFLTGCTEMIVLAGEKAYTHLRGDFLCIVPEKLDDVYAASLEAAMHLDDYQVIEYKLTAINGTEKTTITLSRTENNQTQIQIRIGAFGDKIKSVYIYDSIQEHLRNPKIAQLSF